MYLIWFDFFISYDCYEEGYRVVTRIGIDYDMYAIKLNYMILNNLLAVKCYKRNTIKAAGAIEREREHLNELSRECALSIAPRTENQCIDRLIAYWDGPNCWLHLRAHRQLGAWLRVAREEEEEKPSAERPQRQGRRWRATRSERTARALGAANQNTLLVSNH